MSLYQTWFEEFPLGSVISASQDSNLRSERTCGRSVYVRIILPMIAMIALLFYGKAARALRAAFLSDA
jgi:hypothetical protein